MNTKKPKPATRIQRSGSGHSYFLDGEKAPGVTSVIRDGIPKGEALIGWAANVVANEVANSLTIAQGANGPRIVADDLVENLRRWQQSRTGSKVVPWRNDDLLPRAALADALASLRYRDRDTAGNRGTDVHRLADALARGETVEVPPELAGHVDSYVRFLNEWEPANALLETVGINRQWCYMGKFDLLAEFPGKVWSSGPWQGRPVGRALLDVKTSRSGIFADVALQLQAYRFCDTILTGDGVDEAPMPAVDWVGAIHVRADGYDVFPFDVTDDPKTDPAFRTFLYAKMVGEWLDWKEGPASTVRLDQARPPIDADEATR